MKDPNRLSWKEAFMASPGPRNRWEALVLAAKGACMGAADTVPGVSGGTIAFITGIYEQLLAAIESVDARLVSRLSKFDAKGALAELHIRFILFLFVGIGIAVLSLARLMGYLLENHPVPVWSLFFGLIAASIWSVGRKVDPWSPATMLTFFLGAAGAYFLVGMVPATTPETLQFIFLSGMLAICAMILPGISGAFILLILGKYEFIISAVENPFRPEHMMIIIVFMSGCGVGLAVFSRVLKFLLDRYRPLALAFLTGLMLGSLRKVWPWKESEATQLIHGNLVMIRESNLLPDFGPELAFPAVLMLTGFLAVVILEWLSSEKRS